MPDQEPPEKLIIVLGSALSIDREGGKLLLKSREFVHEISPERLERIGLDCIRQANEARYWLDKEKG